MGFRDSVTVLGDSIGNHMLLIYLTPAGKLSEAGTNGDSDGQ